MKNRDIKKLMKYLTRNRRLRTSGNITLNLIINQNTMTGTTIRELHLQHADVVAGVAEKGSNVFHHKE